MSAKLQKCEQRELPLFPPKARRGDIRGVDSHILYVSTIKKRVGTRKLELRVPAEKRGKEGDVRYDSVHLKSIMTKRSTFEIVNVLAVIALVLSVAWWPLGLGLMLLLIGAFWPMPHSDAPKGSSSVSLLVFKVQVNGPLRIGVVATGIAITLFSLYCQAMQTHGDQLNPTVNEMPIVQTFGSGGVQASDTIRPNVCIRRDY